jgi:hypothetical protein
MFYVVIEKTMEIEMLEMYMTWIYNVALCFQ